MPRFLVLASQTRMIGVHLRAMRPTIVHCRAVDVDGTGGSGAGGLPGGSRVDTWWCRDVWRRRRSNRRSLVGAMKSRRLRGQAFDAKLVVLDEVGLVVGPCVFRSGTFLPSINGVTVYARLT